MSYKISDVDMVKAGMTPPEQREADIPRELMLLAKTIIELNERIAILVEDLTPVLSPKPPAEAGEFPAQPAAHDLAPLAQEIRGNRINAESAILRIRELKARLEV